MLGHFPALAPVEQGKRKGIKKNQENLAEKRKNKKPRKLGGQVEKNYFICEG